MASKPPKKQPAAKIDHQAEELAADERDAEALRRFFAHIIGGTLKPSCRRLGSSQRQRKAKQPPTK